MSRRAIAFVVSGFLGLACESGTRDVVLQRQSCLACHAPLDADGNPDGIEEAHPAYPLGCTDCHGGNGWICDGTISEEIPEEPECDGEWIYDKDQAHVNPPEGVIYARNLSSKELDEIDPAYLRFINPGDFRVLGETCGKCHTEAAAAVPLSTMAHTTGEVTVARYRAGAQPHAFGIYSAVDLTDPNPDPTNVCAVASLQRYNPPPMEITSSDPATMLSVANAQDQYMVKSCMRCHLNDFGENRFEGDFRSSGCTGCHMPYANNGLSLSNDPRISKITPPHPVKHELVRFPPMEQCTHCHYRGGRLGNSFQGYRESAGTGLNPPNSATLGQALHGHATNFYLTDEDTTNDFDETPPDLHFEAGMHCADCHTKADIHGDGKIYSDTQCAVASECTDCHGTAREYANLTTARSDLYVRDGVYYLKTRVGGKELKVKQVKDVVTTGAADHTDAGAQAMGVSANNYSHADTIECYTCHAGWSPSCYGCHIDVDMTKNTRYQTTGESIAGAPTGRRKWSVLNDLVLLWNTDGMLGPSMPAERFFMNVIANDGGTSEYVMTSRPREFTFPGGRKIAGFGQRAFNPHTTRRRSQFMACDRCHTVGDPMSPDNAVLLDLTFGFGTERFPETACDVSNADDSCDAATDSTVYQLDAIQTRAGEPLVVIGHDVPNESRILTLDEIGRMKAISVPPNTPIQTDVPAGALTDPLWPYSQKLE